MSSLYVRQKVEGWLNDAAMTTPFYPTINEEQDPTDPIWVTADFDSAYREVLAFCDGEVKEGRNADPGKTTFEALDIDRPWLAALHQVLADTIPDVEGRVILVETNGGAICRDGIV